MGRSLDVVPVFDEAGLLPFKARAWVDISRRRAEARKSTTET